MRLSAVPYWLQTFYDCVINWHCAHGITLLLQLGLWLLASAAYKCQPVVALIIDPASQGLLLTCCQAWLPFLVYRMLTQDNRLLYLVVQHAKGLGACLLQVWA